VNFKQLSSPHRLIFPPRGRCDFAVSCIHSSVSKYTSCQLPFMLYPLLFFSLLFRFDVFLGNRKDFMPLRRKGSLLYQCYRYCVDQSLTLTHAVNRCTYCQLNESSLHESFSMFLKTLAIVWKPATSTLQCVHPLKRI